MLLLGMFFCAFVAKQSLVLNLIINNPSLVLNHIINKSR